MSVAGDAQPVVQTLAHGFEDVGKEMRLLPVLEVAFVGFDGLGNVAEHPAGENLVAAVGSGLLAAVEGVDERTEKDERGWFLS